MKNKIVSAMMIAMSVTMAAPPVYAAENAAETSADTVEESVEKAMSDIGLGLDEDELDMLEEDPDELEMNGELGMDELDEMNDEGMDPDEIEMNEDLEAEEGIEPLADDFMSTVKALSFSTEIFGEDLSAAIEDFIESIEDNFESVYDVEMHVISSIVDSLESDDPDYVAAVKIQIAKVFEEEFGDELLDAGIEIRDEILTDNDLYGDFEGCEDFATMDDIFTEAGGLLDWPVDYQPENPDLYPDGTDDPQGDESSDSTEAPETTETPTPEATETPEATDTPTPEATETPTPEITDTPMDPDVPLRDYCDYLNDITVQAGNPIQMPGVYWDTTYVASVTIDTSSVDINTPGTYPGAYIITGVDGRIERVDITITVTENMELAQLREEMASRVDMLEAAQSITEEPFAGQWAQIAENAKAQIRNAFTEEEMEIILEGAAEQAQSILLAQQLQVAKNGYIKILNDFYNSLTFDTDSQRDEAERIFAEVSSKITNAQTIDEASTALEEGRSRLQAVEENVPIDDLIEMADTKLMDALESISDTTDISMRAYDVMSERLYACTDPESIDSIVNSSSFVFEDIRRIVEGGDMSSFSSLFTDLKGFAKDSSEMGVIDKVIARGTPEDLDSGELLADDVFEALLDELQEFNDYLSTKCGEDIVASSKDEAYQAYLDVLAKHIADADLQAFRETVIEKLEALLEGRNENYLSDEVREYLQSVEDSIMETSSKEECQSIYDEAAEQFEVLYAKAMTEWYGAQMDALLGGYQFNEDYLAEAQQLIELQKENLAQTTSEDVMNQCLELAKSNLDKLAAEQAEADAIAQARIEAVATVTSMVSNPPERIQKIIDKYVNKINSATSQNEISALVDECRAALEKEQADIMSEEASAMLAKAKTDAIDELKAYMSQSPSRVEMDVLSSYIDLINKAEGVDIVSDLLQRGKTALDEAKQSAQATATPTPSGSSGNQSGNNQSNNQSSNQSSSTDLATLKNEAVKALASMLDSIYNNSSASQTIKAEATDVYNKYVNAINSAMTTSDVQSLLASAKSTLQKYGGKDNTPTPNPQTTTTPNPNNPNGNNPNGNNPNGTDPNNPNGSNPNGTDPNNPNGNNPNGTDNPNGSNPNGTDNPNGTGTTPGPGASLKGDSTVESVKTGDENMGIIAGSLILLVGSLLAAFGIVWKRKKNNKI